jgi:hypothetical protein
MTDLEKFLRTSTRGLWGNERQTVRRELESHVRHRASRYEVSGSSEDDAIKLAIADLGAPREISTGLKGVYTMANTIRAGVLTAALVTFVFMGPQLGTAQVTGTTTFPIPACLEQNKTTYTGDQGGEELPCNGQEFWIKLTSLKSVLEPQGVIVDTTSVLQGEVILRFPEGKTATVKDYMQQTWTDSSGKPNQLRTIRGFIHIGVFLEELNRTGLPMRIEGWNNPTISIGKTSFTLGSSAQPVQGSAVYTGMLGIWPSFLYNYLNILLAGASEMSLNSDATGSTFSIFGNIKLKPGVRLFTHTIKTNLNPGTVMVILAREVIPLDLAAYPQARVEKWPSAIKNRRAFFTPVAEDGTISYTTTSRSLSVVKPDQVIQGVPNGHISVALMKLTSDYSVSGSPVEAIKPETIKIESR